MYKTTAYSAAGGTSPLVSATIPRRNPTEHDVPIDILSAASATAISMK